jgi:hypothetical protein
MGDHAALLLTSYETATFGDSFFGGMAAAEPDAERREKLLLLQEIANRMASWLLPLLERLNGEVERAPGPVAKSLGHSAIAQDWSDLMKGLHDVTPELLATFVRCRETAPNPRHPALVELVRGQEVILAFTELEFAGHSDVSRAALTRYLETVR